AFSGGRRSLFFDDFNGLPLNSRWQALLPNAPNGACPSGTPPSLTANYSGAPNFLFQALGGATVLHMTNFMAPLQRRGWSTSDYFQPANFRYEARFNTLVQSPSTSIDGFIEIWVLDATDPTRYDVVSLFVGNFGATRQFFAGSSVDGLNPCATPVAY